MVSAGFPHHDIKGIFHKDICNYQVYFWWAYLKIAISSMDNRLIRRVLIWQWTIWRQFKFLNSVYMIMCLAEIFLFVGLFEFSPSMLVTISLKCITSHLVFLKGVYDTFIQPHIGLVKPQDWEFYLKSSFKSLLSYTSQLGRLLCARWCTRWCMGEKHVQGTLDALKKFPLNLWNKSRTCSAIVWCQ